MKKTIVSERRWVYLPIETKTREYFAKVLLSCVAAERGWGVLFGKGGVLNNKQDCLPRGTHVFKSISPGRIKDIVKANKFGNRSSAWCEEGLLYLNKEDYRQRRLEKASFESIDYFFSWGKRQAKDIAWALGDNSKIIQSGNPRFDLLKPEFRKIFSFGAQKIKEKFGKIILINTKFAMHNSKLGKIDVILHLRARGKIRNQEQEALMREVLVYQERTFHKFHSIVPVLAKTFDGHTIIIRSHPSENSEPWKKIAKDFSNVHVIFEGNANEWMTAADVTIQNNCTTAVEGFLLERPVVSYRPFQHDEVESGFINQLGLQAQNETELIDIIRAIVQEGKYLDRKKKDEQMLLAKEYIANIEGKAACEVIMDKLEELDLPICEGVFPLRTTLREFAGKLKKKLPTKKQRYFKQKFAGMDCLEIMQTIEAYQSITKRFDGVDVTPVGPNCFCIYSSNE